MTNLRYFGEPVMYAVRSDVRTPDEKARLVYAWLQIAKDHMPEVMIPNKGYRGNRDRPDFIFGSDLFAAIYTWKDIPNFEEFSKRLHENGDTALCIASVSLLWSSIFVTNMAKILFLNRYIKYSV